MATCVCFGGRAGIEFFLSSLPFRLFADAQESTFFFRFKFCISADAQELINKVCHYDGFGVWRTLKNQRAQYTSMAAERVKVTSDLQSLIQLDDSAEQEQDQDQPPSYDQVVSDRQKCRPNKIHRATNWPRRIRTFFAHFIGHLFAP